jgi:hypothetical protein
MDGVNGKGGFPSAGRPGDNNKAPVGDVEVKALKVVKP